MKVCLKAKYTLDHRTGKITGEPLVVVDVPPEIFVAALVEINGGVAPWEVCR